ncbi:hypothetical protein HK100_004395, partial [Physocladia obscura]
MIVKLLQALELTAADLKDGKATLVDEFDVIKKKYFGLALRLHPDKGGDAGAFRIINEAFEALRAMFADGAVRTFVSDASTSGVDAGDNIGNHAEHNAGNHSNTSFGFWFFADSAADIAAARVPFLRVERARSSRSRCHGNCHLSIAKNDLRVGHIDPVAGAYSMWLHLSCWKVPRKVWGGLIEIVDVPESQLSEIQSQHQKQNTTKTVLISDPARIERALDAMNEIVMCGFNLLLSEERLSVVAHVMDPATWVKPPANLDRSISNALPGRKRSYALLESAEESSAKHSLNYISILTAKPTTTIESKPIKTAKLNSPKASIKLETTTAIKLEPTPGIKSEPSPSIKSDPSASIKLESALKAKLETKSISNLYYPPSQFDDRKAKKTSISKVKSETTHNLENNQLVRSVSSNSSRHFVKHTVNPDFLQGQTIVLTGIFPEIGGGMGLNLGKDRLKAICESFGARVTSAVSGRTTLLIVGEEPGMAKVTQARMQEKCRLIGIRDFTCCIEGKQDINESFHAPQIEGFSAGYNFNGRALNASAYEYNLAVGSQFVKPRKYST